MTITCGKCKVEKSTDEFSPCNRGYGSPTARRRWNSWCKPCAAAYARALGRRDGGKVYRERNLRSTYGIAAEEFDAMLEAQGGVCAACGGPADRGRGKRFHVDHDHETGKIRGLLCVNCNVALGQAGDSRERLEQLISYLDRTT